MRAGRTKVFLFAALAVAAVKLARSWHWSVGCFYLWIGAVWLVQGRPDHSIDEIVLITATLFLVPELARRVSLRAFENFAMAAGLLHCIVSVFNLYGIFPFFKVTVPLYTLGRIPMGLIGQETLLGVFLAFCSGVALYRLLESRHLFYAFLLLFNVAILVACQSVMSALSLLSLIPLFVLFYVGFLPFVGVTVGMALLGGLGLYLFPGLAGFSGRLVPWHDAWELIKFRPLSGFGMGSWWITGWEIGRMRKETPWLQLHSDALQGLFQYGIVGMFFVAALALRVLGKVQFLYLFRERRMVPYIGGILVFGVNGLANFPLRITPFGQIFAYCVFVVLAWGTNEGFQSTDRVWFPFSGRLASYFGGESRR